MNTIQLTAPSHWASYLVNGNASGLEHDEIASCDAWCEAMGVAGEGMGVYHATCVDCEDAGFCWHHDANQFALAADCQLYTFIIPEVPTWIRTLAARL